MKGIHTTGVKGQKMNLHEIAGNNGHHLNAINTLGPAAVTQAKAFSNLLLVEEMSELTKEIVKIYARGKDDRWPEYYEELADVILVLDQIVRMANAQQLQDALLHKISRYYDRYGEGR